MVPWQYKDKQLYVRISFGIRDCAMSNVYDSTADDDNFWHPSSNEHGTIRIKQKGKLKHAGIISVMGLDGLMHETVRLWKSPFLNRFWVRLEDLV